MGFGAGLAVALVCALGMAEKTKTEGPAAKGGVSVVTAAPAAVFRHGNGSQFRGPNASGVAPVRHLPTEFNATKNVIPKTPCIALGWGRPEGFLPQSGAALPAERPCSVKRKR